VQEQASEIEGDDVATRFDADFSIMTLELSAFVSALIEAFGGAEEIEQAGSGGFDGED
jgi:recombination associated protein RdgC